MRAAPSWFFPHPVVPQGQDWEKWQEQTQSRAELARLEGQQQKSAPSCELERAAGGMPQSQEAAEIAAFFVYNYLAVLVFEQQLADSVHDVDAYTPRAICAGLAWGSPSAHGTAGATPGLTARGCRDCSNNRKQQQQQQQQPVLLSSSSSAGEEREGGFFSNPSCMHYKKRVVRRVAATTATLRDPRRRGVCLALCSRPSPNPRLPPPCPAALRHEARHGAAPPARQFAAFARE